MSGGILGTLILASICIIIGINLWVVRDGFGASNDEPATTIEETTSSEEKEDGLLNEDFEEKVNSIYNLVQEHFLYDVDDDALRDSMYAGLINGLGDPYSSYYTAEEFNSFQESTNGSYYGIGVSVSQNIKTGIITLVKPFRGSPSYEAGILPGDVLFSVNGTEVTGMDLQAVVAMIKGEEGSTVKLTVVREGEAGYLDFDVERRQVEMETVEYEMLDNNIGYMLITGFEAVTTSQFYQALAELSTSGMEGLVIDLRNNPGGRLDVVTAMLDMILPEGILVYTEDKNGTRGNEIYSNEMSVLKVPLTVLVNGESASASEIFAGDIQDFKAGTIIGTQTFGKGIVQTVYPLDENTAVKMTVSSYFTHGGRNIHGTGIQPDIEIELDESLKQKKEIEKSEDNQLQKAIEVLMEQIGQD